VLPSCAVTSSVIVLAPAFRLIAPEAAPLFTCTPLTVTVAFGWFTTGVTVIELTVTLSV
jgi:hypothetical protein